MAIDQGLSNSTLLTFEPDNFCLLWGVAAWALENVWSILDLYLPDDSSKALFSVGTVKTYSDIANVPSSTKSASVERQHYREMASSPLKLVTECEFY